LTNDTLKIHKGELVILSPNHSHRSDRTVPCWRPTNEQEDEAWRNEVRSSPLDDAGEPRIRPLHPYATDRLNEGTLAIVIKARCRANIGWQNYGKLVQVLIPSNGNTYYVQRKYVAKAVSNENPVHQ